MSLRTTDLISSIIILLYIYRLYKTLICLKVLWWNITITYNIPCLIFSTQYFLIDIFYRNSKDFQHLLLPRHQYTINHLYGTPYVYNICLFGELILFKYTYQEQYACVITWCSYHISAKFEDQWLLYHK